jgi:hypothetical protein
MNPKLRQAANGATGQWRMESINAAVSSSRSINRARAGGASSFCEIVRCPAWVFDHPHRENLT